MASRRKTSSKNRKAHRRLLLSGAQALPGPVTIPTRWLNNVIALFLLPVAVVFTQAFFTCFGRAVIDQEFWKTEEFWFFTLGAVFWTLAFCGSIWVFGEPRLLRLYVFGHEFTHALWAKAMGGKIFGFKVARDGGFVLTDKTNFWIALAPYFYPLYSIVIIAAYGAASLFYDLHGYTPVLFGLLGLTWAFHFSFTLWMIPKGQTDLSAHGNFFSWTVIYVLNLVLLSALLILAAPEVTFLGFGRELVRHAAHLAEFILTIFNTGLRHVLNRAL